MVFSSGGNSGEGNHHETVLVAKHDTEKLHFFFDQSKRKRMSEMGLAEIERLGSGD